jgi:hypothetical protein
MQDIIPIEVPQFDELAPKDVYAKIKYYIPGIELYMP